MDCWDFGMIEKAELWANGYNNNPSAFYFSFLIIICDLLGIPGL